MVKGYDKFKNGAAMNARHYSHNDYYEKGHKIPGIVFGNLSPDLGLENGQPIDDRAFRLLSDNKHAATGEQLTRRVPNRKPFCDITCAMPKTFSVLGIVGGDERVWRYQQSAVEKVKAELQTIVGRQNNKPGGAHVERTGCFSGVAYEHDNNASQECHIHTHLIIWNVTRSANGKLYAMEFREPIDRSSYLTRVYWDELARQARVDGLNIEQGEHGEPVIVELREMAKEHQQRSNELDVLLERIEDHAGTKLGPREISLIVRASRGLDVAEFEKRWDALKGELDTLKSLDPDTAEQDRRAVLEHFRASVQSCSKSELKVTTTAKVRASMQARVTPEQRQTLEAVKITSHQSELINVTLDQSIDFAIQHCFQNESVIKDYELYETVLQHAQGQGVDLPEMKAKVAIHSGVILGLHGEVGSAEHYRQERETVQRVEQGKGKAVKGIDDDPFQNERLSELQRDVVKSLVESRDRFTALSGSAGVGKTEFVLAEVIKANLAAGHSVTVVAPSDAARDVLHQDAKNLAPGAVRDTLAGACSLQLYQANPKLHGQMVKGDLLIIDEASFVSLKQGHTAFEHAAANGYRVLMVGDLAQGKSIEAGDFFRLAIKSGVHTAELHDIKRQAPDALEGHYLAAVKLFKRGQTTEAFRELYLAGCIHELKGTSRVEAYAQAIVESEAAGVPTIAANFTHRENDAVAAAVRERMKAAGKLTDERTVTVYSTLGWSDAEKRDVSKLKPSMVLEITRGKDKGTAYTIDLVRDGHAYARAGNGQVRQFSAAHCKLFDVCESRELAIAIGDKILVRSGSRKDQVANQQRLTVAGWDELGNPIADGRVITHRNLCYGYVRTARSVQGDTSTRVITGFDRHSVKAATRDIPYVLNSRGREDCQIYVESIADLSQIQNRSGDRKAVSEMVIKEVPAQARVQTIVRTPVIDLQASKYWAREQEQGRERGRGRSR